MFNYLYSSYSISAEANLLAHNNKSQICYCNQILLQGATVHCSFTDTFGGNIYFAVDGTFINGSTYSTILNKFKDMKLKDSRNVFLGRVFGKT